MEGIQGAKYRWLLPRATMQDVYAQASSYNFSMPVMQTLMGRGFSGALLDRYLASSYEETVAHPSLLQDAEKAVERLLLALERGEKILIAGDYDVDGITSSALLLACLKPLGANINFFLPNRVRDGYGLSMTTVERAAVNGYRVIITVDNGITAFEAAAVARARDIDLIITDHHRPPPTLPAAYAIVNPHRIDCGYPFKKFAGVGVGFKLMHLLYEKIGRVLPAKVYELLLLGTVADVVPLLDENRFWVRYCLGIVNANESLALKVLKENGRCTKSQLTATDIGFSIAPQLNALGRLDDAREGVNFLLGVDEIKTREIGAKLAALNKSRKEIELSVLLDVERQITAGTIDLRTNLVIVAGGANWPPGVIGLVASRLVGTYGRPAIILHRGTGGIAKGSCRSIPEVNIFDALSEARDLLVTFGGHPMAAGLSLREENIPELQQRLNAYVMNRTAPEDLVQKITLDAELPLGEANSKLLADLAYMEPFGCENPAPKFYVPRASLVEPPTLLKEAHVKCQIFSEGTIKPVIFFNRPDLYQPLVERMGTPCSFAVSVLENEWQGRTRLELQGIDIAW